MTSAVAASHSIRAMIVGLIFLVLGILGIYDYIWAIPQQERDFQRGEIARNVLASLNTITTGDDPELVRETVNSIDQMLSAPMTDSGDETVATWRQSLAVFRDGLQPPSEVSPTDWPALRKSAQDQAEKALGLYDDVTPPSKYDRPIQWFFILCLPFVPYYAWSFFGTRKRHYRLDVDGTFHMPEGVWNGDEIADIDMHRWMSKSICWVVSRDSSRVKLDAHIYKNLDKIIGVIAHRLHPEQWTEDARPIKTDTQSPSTVDEEG